MILEYIKNTYPENEPIFFKDLLNIENNKYKLSKQLNQLVKDKQINKYCDGIYFLPKQSIIKDLAPSPQEIAKYKYVQNGNEFYGYYTGIYLANRLGLTTQVPSIIEIITNNSNSSSHIVTFEKQKFYIKSSIIDVNNKNVYTLQLLDLLKDIDKYNEYSIEYAGEKLKNFIVNYGINKINIDTYISLFPISVYKNYYELRLEDVFTRK